MRYALQNEFCTVEVNEKGAELASFRSRVPDLEYIWTADPAFWPRHAPVLFPIVGQVPDGKYRYRGQEYKMGQHGFARDQNFQTVETSPTKLVFALEDNPSFRLIYPFPFRLEISYELRDTTLTVVYRVINTGPEEMLFSIGAHPAFNCPLFPGERFSDYYLEFSERETQNRYLLDHGLQNGNTAPVLQNTDRLPLDYALFAQDAIVLKNLASEEMVLKTDLHEHGLAFRAKGFPFFGIWTKGEEAPFICLEPWHGIAGSPADREKEFGQKEGIIRLEPGRNFNCRYQIRIF